MSGYLEGVLVLLAVNVVFAYGGFLPLAAGQGASWLTAFIRGGGISQGTYEYAFYTVLSVQDVLYSLIKGMVMSFFVVLTALYYGYRVRGGPVEVGVATARSMAVNLVAVTVLNMIMTFIFWGFNPNLPIA